MNENSIQENKCLVSACLVGLCTRYDGACKACPSLLSQISNRFWIPLCPEQLGGLATPRPPADLFGGDGHDVLAGRAKVLTRDGTDVTSPFILGARQCLAVAQAQHIRTAYLKARSPSCGLQPQRGVTAALLMENGIMVIEVD